MEERRKEEAIEAALRVVREDIEVLAGALVVIQTKVQEHQLWMDGVDEVGWDERIAAVEAGLVREMQRLDVMDELLRGLLVNRFDVRVLALEVGMKRLSDWQAEADERLDWRRRPAAE